MTDSLLMPDLAAGSPSKLFNIIFLALGVIAAALLVAYLIRCYFQEFRRNRRVLRRRRASAPVPITLPAPLTFAPPTRKAPAYRVAPIIYYTVTATSVPFQEPTEPVNPHLRQILVTS